MSGLGTPVESVFAMRKLSGPHEISGNPAQNAESGAYAGDGSPAVGREVRLYEAAEGYIVTAQYVDASGGFAFKDIASGDYHVVLCPLDTDIEQGTGNLFLPDVVNVTVP